MLQDGGSFRTGVNPDGLSDKTVSVLSFKDLDGNPVSYLYSYAVHSTMMLFSQVKDGGMLFSGDLAGAASRYIEEQTDVQTITVEGQNNPILCPLSHLTVFILSIEWGLSSFRVIKQLFPVYKHDKSHSHSFYISP